MLLVLEVLRVFESSWLHFSLRSLDLRSIVIDDDRLPLAVHVERLGARLAEPVARVLDAAKRHVRAGAVGRTVDRHEPGPIARDELFDAMAVGGVNRAGEPERCRVGERERLVEARDAIQA